jgi:hypothetical protein
VGFEVDTSSLGQHFGFPLPILLATHRSGLGLTAPRKTPLRRTFLQKLTVVHLANTICASNAARRFIATFTRANSILTRCFRYQPRARVRCRNSFACSYRQHMPPPQPQPESADSAGPPDPKLVRSPGGRVLPVRPCRSNGERARTVPTCSHRLCRHETSDLPVATLLDCFYRYAPCAWTFRIPRQS